MIVQPEQRGQQLLPALPKLRHLSEPLVRDFRNDHFEAVALNASNLERYEMGV